MPVFGRHLSRFIDTFTISPSTSRLALHLRLHLALETLPVFFLWHFKAVTGAKCMRQLCARVKVAHRFIVSIQVVCGVLHKLPKPCHKLWLMIDINSNAPLAAVNMSLTQKPAKKKTKSNNNNNKINKKLSINFELNCAKCVWKMCKHEAISRTKTCNTHTQRDSHTHTHSPAVTMLKSRPSGQTNPLAANLAKDCNKFQLFRCDLHWS